MSADTTNLIHSATAQFVESSNTATFLLDSFDNKVKLETSNRGLTLSSASAVQDRYFNELKALQLSEDTYLKAATGDEFAKWQEAFEPDANKAAVSDLLIENSSMRLIYSKLVPAQISNDQFWCRYFFKANVFEEEHRKRIKLLERVKDAAGKTEEDTEEEAAADWDEDEDEDAAEEEAEDTTINNSKEKEAIESGGSEPSSPPPRQDAAGKDADEEISREVAQLLIEEQTNEVLSEIAHDVSEIAEAVNESFEEKVVKTKSHSGVGGESMVSSVKTEDSE